MAKLYTNINVDPPNTYYGEAADGWVWAWRVQGLITIPEKGLSPALIRNSKRAWVETDSGIYWAIGKPTELNEAELKEFDWIKLKAHSIN